MLFKLKIFSFLLFFINSALYADSQMFKAAKSGNNTKIIILLSQGENIDERDKLGWTPLFEAISWGKIETAKLLIKNKASINIVNSEGNTPLHLASFLGHIELVKLLVNSGAEINAKNNDGQTPLHFAVIGKIEIAEFLLNEGAKKLADKYGNKPIDHTLSEEMKNLLGKYE